MQQVVALAASQPIFLSLPAPDTEVMSNVVWGRFEDVFTPAFWAAQAWMDSSHTDGNFSLGRSLAEELVACLLGGHGAPAEVGLAAFQRVATHLREHGPTLSHATAIDLLSRPLAVNGRWVRYRFANTRARYLVGSLQALPHIQESELDDTELRNRLCALPGIGLKTASWIVRNQRGSDQVAILDVHIMRAGIMMGVFEKGSSPARGYLGLEARFLTFCRAVGVRPSQMDAVMWRTMRNVGPILMGILIPSSNSRSNALTYSEGDSDVGRRRRRR
jgi:thermostable 8-oxoguanine DNA glycosylase